MYDDYDYQSLGTRLIVGLLRKLLWLSLGLIAMLWLIAQAGIPVGTEISLILHPATTVQAQLTHAMSGITSLGTSTGTGTTTP